MNGTERADRHEDPDNKGIRRPQPANTRERLLTVLGSFQQLARWQDAHAVTRGISVLLQKVEQNRFYLTVVGQFKRGKTSFLNALLGAEVLPVAILPLTSIVTILRYGQRPGAEVVFQSGNRTSIQVAQIAEYVTERGNPKNVKLVSHVEVAYPSEYLRRGVALVDTPGIGSVYSHNTQITYDFLPQVDAAIFVTSPESPLTSTEIDFLADLAQHVRKVFVVLNKTDQVNEAQLREIMEFLRHSLPETVATDPDSWFALSAVRAFEAKQRGDAGLLAASGFTALESKLAEFLVSEKNAVFYASIARNARKLIADLRLVLELQVRTAQMPADELRAKLAELDQHLASAQQEREDSQVLLENSVARLSGVFETEAKRFSESMVEPLRGEVRDQLRSLAALGRKEQASQMDRFLKQRIERIFEDWRSEFEKSASDGFRQATNRFAERVNELILEVRRTTGSLFGFSVESFDATEELAELEACGYLTDPVLDWGLGNAPLLLPSALFRRYLRRVMLRKVELELERNATRVAFDYKRRLRKSHVLFLEGMSVKLNETAEGIRNAVEGALNRQQETSAAAELQVAKRQAALAQLHECEDQLNRILSESEKGSAHRVKGNGAGLSEARTDCLN